MKLLKCIIREIVIYIYHKLKVAVQSLAFVSKDETKAQAFVDALTLPLVSVSLGGVETILSHPATMSHAAVPEEVRNERGITFGLFRLSVGLEQPEELIADIDYALKEAFNESIIEPFEEQRFSS